MPGRNVWSNWGACLLTTRRGCTSLVWSRISIRRRQPNERQSPLRPRKRGPPATRARRLGTRPASHKIPTWFKRRRTPHRPDSKFVAAQTESVLIPSTRLGPDCLTPLSWSFTFGGAVSRFALLGPRRGVFPLNGQKPHSGQRARFPHLGGSGLPAVSRMAQL